MLDPSEFIQEQEEEKQKYPGCNKYQCQSDCEVFRNEDTGACFGCMWTKWD